MRTGNCGESLSRPRGLLSLLRSEHLLYSLCFLRTGFLHRLGHDLFELVPLANKTSNPAFIFNSQDFYEKKKSDQPSPALGQPSTCQLIAREQDRRGCRAYGGSGRSRPLLVFSTQGQFTVLFPKSN